MTFKEKLEELADKASKENDHNTHAILENQRGKIVSFMNKYNFSQTDEYVEPD